MTRVSPDGATEVAGLERTKAVLESDLTRTSLELRLAAEEYDALAEAHRLSVAQLLEAETAIGELRRERGELIRSRARLDAELEAMRQDRDRVRARLEEVCSTRVWRFGSLYWRLLRKLGLLRTETAAAPEPAVAPSATAAVVPEASSKRR